MEPCFYWNLETQNEFTVTNILQNLNDGYYDYDEKRAFQVTTYFNWIRI